MIRHTLEKAGWLKAAPLRRPSPSKPPPEMLLRPELFQERRKPQKKKRRCIDQVA
jgi:hypothetical protein